MPTVACCRRFARSVTNGTSVYAGLRWALPPWPPVQRFLAVLCLVAQLCLIFCDPKDCSLPGSSVHGDSPGKNTGVWGTCTKKDEPT